MKDKEFNKPKLFIFIFTHRHLPYNNVADFVIENNILEFNIVINVPKKFKICSYFYKFYYTW
ncbi:hypothetical protein GCM10008931_45000 [Oceanobacillus oncorhynchi subsp. oncorhynchi]